MPFIKTFIPELLIFEPHIINDSRGYFFEGYNQQAFREAGVNIHFVQDNQSQSSYGVLRGLHFQVPPFAQAKIIRVLSGSILDVAVDIRKGSPTYGKWFGIRLNTDNKRQLFIPVGFAHGFSVLSKTAEVFYKCDNFYSKEHDRGIRYDDPLLNIDWEIDIHHATLSEKDKNLPLLENTESPFVYSPNS